MPLYFWGLSLVVLAFFSFANSIPHPFVHDDIVFILQNPQINRLDNLSEVFFPQAMAHPQGINAYYRPVLEVAYRLQYALFGFNAWGFHLVNVLLHIANGLLLFSLLQRLNITRGIAWVVSLFFLIHPLQSEAVACVAGISNLLMAFLIFCILHLYLRQRWIAAAMLLWVALLTKEQAVMVPLLIIFLDIYRWKNRGQIPILRWSILVGVVVLSLLWRGAITGSSVLHDIMQSPGELILRLKAIAPVLLTDLRLILAPYDLHYYRSHDILQSPSNAWLLLIALGLIFTLIYRRLKSLRGVLLLGAGLFLITIGPLLNVVPLINEYSFILTAEHFLYLPIIGALIILASLASLISASTTENRGQRPIFIRVTLFFLIVISVFLTIQQNTFWRSEIALFERMVQFEPNFSRGRLLLAKAYYFAQRFDQADVQFAKAYEIMMGYVNKVKDPQAKRFYLGFTKGILFDWAHVYEARGQWGQALAKYEEAIQIDPHDPILRNNAAVCALNIK